MVSAALNTEKISILMPVKNAADFLPETIETIRNQSYRNWELICIDDHSTDHSFSIIESFVKQDDRIKIFTNNGSGIIPALQTAEKKASGTMVSRMDADDLLPPDRYKNQYHLLKNKGSGFLISGKVDYFSSSKTLQEGFIKYANWLNRLCETNTHYHEIYKECVIASPSWLMYMEDFKIIGGFSDLIYPEDYDFVFRLYKKRIEIASVNEVVLYWRDHPERASRNLPQYQDATFFELKWKRFLELDRNHDLPLFLYGAGPKGKKLAKVMQSYGTEFRWISGNKKKVDHLIYGIQIETEAIMKDIDRDFQLIVAISSPSQLREAKKCIPYNADIFYFC